MCDLTDNETKIENFVEIKQNEHEVKLRSRIADALKSTEKANKTVVINSRLDKVVFGLIENSIGSIQSLKLMSLSNCQHLAPFTRKGEALMITTGEQAASSKIKISQFCAKPSKAQQHLHRCKSNVCKMENNENVGHQGQARASWKSH